MSNRDALIGAINLALTDKWDEAHRTVQDYSDPYACWIHAVLHKIEGDEGNSRYWYARAGRAFTNATHPNEELEQIKSLLMKQ